MTVLGGGQIIPRIVLRKPSVIYARKRSLIANCSHSSLPPTASSIGDTEGRNTFLELAEKAVAATSLLATRGALLADVIRLSSNTLRREHLFT